MTKPSKANDESPCIKDSEALTIAGLNERYSHVTRMNIPAQWQRFAPRIGMVPRQVNGVAYGVCWNFDSSGSFDYMTGVEVADASQLPDDFACVSVPAQRYAVFTHRGRITKLPDTIQKVWTLWLPESGHQAAQAPFLERYDHRFNAQTGEGEVELWVAIKA